MDSGEESPLEELESAARTKPSQRKAAGKVGSKMATRKTLGRQIFEKLPTFAAAEATVEAAETTVEAAETTNEPQRVAVTLQGKRRKAKALLLVALALLLVECRLDPAVTQVYGDPVQRLTSLLLTASGALPPSLLPPSQPPIPPGLPPSSPPPSPQQNATKSCEQECSGWRVDEMCPSGPKHLSECENHEIQTGCSRSCCQRSCRGAFGEQKLCDRTVAYAFIVRSALTLSGLWDLWAAYFATCAQGDAVPIAHTQGDADDRDRLMTMLAPFGGRLVPLSDTTAGNPRWSWRIMPMIFALYRLAGEIRGLNGCRPKWVHLLSGRDVPVRPCPAVHQLLAWHPGVSRISLFRDDGGPEVNHIHYPCPFKSEHAQDITDARCSSWCKWTAHCTWCKCAACSFCNASSTVAPTNDHYPIGHTDEWTTLALPHALAIADATQQKKLYDKWEHIYWKGKVPPTEGDGWMCPFNGNAPEDCRCALTAYASHVGFFLQIAAATRLPAANLPRGEEPLQAHSPAPDAVGRYSTLTRHMCPVSLWQDGLAGRNCAMDRA